MSEITVDLQNIESNTAGWISWARLERQLRRSGELSLNESITRIVADEDGIRYFIEKVDS